MALLKGYYGNTHYDQIEDDDQVACQNNIPGDLAEVSLLLA